MYCSDKMTKSRVILWMLLLALLAVREAAASVSIVPAVGTSYLGKAKVFICRTSGREATIKWKKPNGDEIDESDEEKLNIELVDETTSKLTFTSITKEDAGKYECEATFDDGGDISRAMVMVTVIQSPQFININTTQEYLAGENADIVCDVEGIPPPLVTWTYNGQNISNKHDGRISIQSNGHLQIKNISQSDAGTYTCKASIPQRNEVNSMDISVFINYSPVFERPETESLYTMVEIPINLTFTISARPKASLSLTLNGTDVGIKQVKEIAGAKQETMQHFYLQVSSMTNDVDTYEITATNEIGTASKTFIVRAGSQKKGIGTGAIVGIIMVIFLLLLIAVDVSCYYTNQCGMLMCLAVNLLGKQPIEAKRLEAEKGDVTVVMNQSNEKGCSTSVPYSVA